MTKWAILTGEYPPQSGGVSDYARLVAGGLAAAGDAVTVYAPPADVARDTIPGVTVRRLPGHFCRRSRAAISEELARTPPDRVLVQYVPHAFGCKAMNFPFAYWLARLARRHPIWVMFHEVLFPFSWRPWKHALLAVVTRRMAGVIASAAERIFVAIPGWVPLLRRASPGACEAEWLPVPSTIPATASPDAVAAARRTLAVDPGQTLVGHFGTYGGPIPALLGPIAQAILDRVEGLQLAFIGRGSDTYRRAFLASAPRFERRVSATGELEPARLSACLRACDLLVQPYPDGVSSRRTSVMAGLANGVAVVTNLGALSGPLWGLGGVAAADAPDPTAIARLASELAANSTARAELAAQGGELYRTTFALERTLDRLRKSPRIP